MTKETYTLGSGCTLTDLTDHKGEVTHAIHAKLHVPGMARAINTTYDVLNHNLILREWYLLSDAQLASTEAMLTTFFADYMTAK